MSIFAQLTTRNTDEPHLRQPETRTSSPSLCILSSALDFVPVTRATREIRAPILRDPLSKNQSLYLSLSLSLSFSLFRKFLDDLDVSKDRGSATRRKEREREREKASVLPNQRIPRPSCIFLASIVSPRESPQIIYLILFI